ncbi:zinc ribbon domain-containing protein [Guyparkeria sp.]|uniref:zinc ribbon domain-containing protein n=1 Tax=Guyparkeria sp. TaxID=2035736 RepID=UPI003970AEC0
MPPQNTNRSCSACGHEAKDNRPSQSRFESVACGHTAHADWRGGKPVLAPRCRYGGPVEAGTRRGDLRWLDADVGAVEILVLQGGEGVKANSGAARLRCRAAPINWFSYPISH